MHYEWRASFLIDGQVVASDCWDATVDGLRRMRALYEQPLPPGRGIGFSLCVRWGRSYADAQIIDGLLAEKFDYCDKPVPACFYKQVEQVFGLYQPHAPQQ